MAKKKYLRKNEFRKYNNPKFLSKSGEAHPAYISLKYKHKVKANVITHSKTFFNKETLPLSENPDKNKRNVSDGRQTRISVSFWDNEKQFSKNKLSGWRYSKEDRKKIKKWNKKNQP